MDVPAVLVDPAFEPDRTFEFEGIPGEDGVPRWFGLAKVA
jgi:hypothetical protein